MTYSDLVKRLRHRIAHDTAVSPYSLMAEAATALRTQPSTHPDDEAVDRFAATMKAKLKWEREERGRAGWQAMSAEELSRLLFEHLPKGDPVDVANFCMMLSLNGQVIAPQPSDRGEVSEQQRREIAFDVKREIRFAFRKALVELPEIAPPEISGLLASVMMHDAFLTEGKRLQREHGTDAVAPRVEQECAAGAWSFMRQGVLTALEPTPPAGEGEVKVKPLVWSSSRVFGTTKWRGSSPFGEFAAFVSDDMTDAQISERKERYETEYRQRILSCIEPSSPAGEGVTVTPEELLLLLRLRDNQGSGVHDVVERDPEKWALGFVLSDRGLLAMVDHPKGATFHITRLGLNTVLAALSKGEGNG